MMKNWKMSTALTFRISAVTLVCISLLYLIASHDITTLLKSSEMKNRHSFLNAQTSLIEEYVTHQEDLLIAFSKAPVVIDFLKNPTDPEKKRMAQNYTENYYTGLKNWEGLYVAEWDTHIIAHSNPKVVGITTREGDGLKELQGAMKERQGLYNTGIIISPASQKLTLSMYCPVFDKDA